MLLSAAQADGREDVKSGGCHGKKLVLVVRAFMKNLKEDFLSVFQRNEDLMT